MTSVRLRQAPLVRTAVTPASLAAAQPVLLIIELLLIVLREPVEGVVVLPHLAIHLGEDGKTSLTTFAAIVGAQDPHALRCPH